MRLGARRDTIYVDIVGAAVVDERYVEDRQVITFMFG